MVGLKEDPTQPPDLPLIGVLYALHLKSLPGKPGHLESMIYVTPLL